MLRKFPLILVLICFSNVYCQDGRIILSEKIQGKRLSLIAENTTSDTINIFLMVISEGYRRSAARPVVKNIPPNSKVPMMTMIELANTPSSYSYNLIINDQENDLQFNRVKEEIDIEKALKNKLVIFTKTNCDKCDLLSSALEAKDYNFRTFNIDEDRSLYDQFLAFIKKTQPEKIVLRFPVIWNKDHTIYSFDSLDEVLGKLAN